MRITPMVPLVVLIRVQGQDVMWKKFLFRVICCVERVQIVLRKKFYPDYMFDLNFKTFSVWVTVAETRTEKGKRGVRNSISDSVAGE